MVWNEYMESEYQKAVDWYTDLYYDEIVEYKQVLKIEYSRKLEQIKEDIKNGLV